MQGETKQSPQYGHQRANTTYTPSQNMASKTIHKPPNGANSTHLDTKDDKGQLNSVSRPAQTEKTEDPKSKNATRRFCWSTWMTHKNQPTTPRLVVWKQQHYLTPAPHSAAYQNISTIASVTQNHQGSLTQTQDQPL